MNARRWLLPVLLTALPLLANAQAVRDKHVEAELVAPVQGLQPGTTQLIGLRLKHDPHWHTYWKTTYTGYATSLDWELPEDFATSDILWPAPRTYSYLDNTEYVYEDEVVLPVALTVPAGATPGTSVTLRATAEWLMCAETCIPGRAELSLTLPIVAQAPAPEPRWQALFAEAERLQPVKPEVFTVTAHRSGTELYLVVEGQPLPEEAYLFDASRLILPEVTQDVTRRADGALVLTLPIDPAGDNPATLSGVLVAQEGTFSADADRPALAIETPIQDGLPPGMAANVPASRQSLWGILLFALGGGLLLNLMPCVFPVLGIKAMGLVQQAGSDRRKVVLHGLTFAGGVILSLWLLVGLLLVLRAGGDELGWGFQLQNPWFVYGLTLFLFLFGLNLSGVFEIGESAVGLGSNLTQKSGLRGSFFSGILATVVATPCSAPLLGTSLGVALTLSPTQTFLVFTAMGLGIALPYLTLSLFPNLIRALPRPGPWMETFKQGMAFLLYATVAYFFWVFSHQVTEEAGYPANAALLGALALVLTGMAAWIYGRYGRFHLPRMTRLVGTAGAIALLAGAVYLGAPSKAAFAWQKWEPGLAEELAAQGRTVYVDFTATWCLTCQTNKQVVFSSSEVLREFDRRDVVALKADWTSADPAITRELAKYQRSAVPFNLIYGPGQTEPVVLPELLTPGIVLERLRSLDQLAAAPEALAGR